MAIDKKIDISKMPQAAQMFLTKAFPNNKVTSAMMDDRDYKVMMTDGTSVEFDAKGVWKDIECTTGSVPMSVLPQAIQKELTAKHSGMTVHKVEKDDDGGYDLKLSNGKELKFDSKLKPCCN